MPIPLKMTVYKGSELVGEHAFDRDIIKIGRLASAHLKLDDTKVSRIHAVVEATSDGQDYSVIDMGSTEGTILNGARISKEKLKDGDEIRLGDSRIVIQFVKAAANVGPTSSRSVPPPAPEPSGDVGWSPSPAEMAAAEPTQTLAPVSPFAQQPQAQPQMQMMPAMMQPQMMQGADGQVYAAPYGYVPVGTMPPGAMPPGMMSNMPATMPPMGYPQQPMMQQAYQGQTPISGPGVPQMSGIPMGGYVQQNPFGAQPNNLASDNVPDTERALEIKTIWGNSVIDTISATTKPTITMGDERKVTGFGPFQQAIHCDIEVPSKGLPSKTYVIAEHQGGEGSNYTIHIPGGSTGHIERADGTMIGLDQLMSGGHGAEQGDYKGAAKYRLRPAETIYLTVDTITLQIRYIRTTRLVPPGFMAEMNYTWVNILVLAFFLHTMAIVSFVATPHTSSELTEDIFKNPNRFAKYLLTPEQKQKQNQSLLSKLKSGETGAKAKGTEGKAGRKDYDAKAKQGRMAVKGDPNQEEIAKSTLTALFGKGTAGRSYLFGSGGLGGELKGALGGVTGAEIGDATGLGGLGTRGNGPGGGGLSMNSVGLGALGTAGRGSGGSGGDGYGEGASGLGKKADRDINISAGSPVIMGSLDKEIIRRIIKQHIAQIRYCYEKELVRSPGLFGKVATSFTISGDGHVQSASVTESTLKNDEVERCITAKIRTWEFPKPKGGGVVVVKYPFIFKTTG
jgi:TonB family protein